MVNTDTVASCWIGKHVKQVAVINITHWLQSVFNTI